MREKIYQQLIELTNGQTSSNILMKFAKSSYSKKFIRSYSKLYGIDIEEVSKKMEQFQSLHEFFTRELKAEARPIDENPSILVSPVDAKLEAFGEMKDNVILTVKDKPYSLVDLLGSEQAAKRYEKGQYIVFYLSPADYHRMHSPVNAYVEKQYILGKKSFPVNQIGLQYGKKPISHNYRMVSELVYGKDKHAAFIKVGATFVNSIVLTNTSKQWKKGEEVGYFSFGSTVVMLFESETIAFLENVQQGQAIRMGEAFATML
ncbi:MULTISPECIES: phosphatidylserine decarboxylase [Bacillales]|uniref:phosphatidylserine decarboxylase n=1 Tax=Lysinibacillus louembei TaxID=1470088 RepID=A0ABZ0RTT9_9BACI|nr:MULTISPECIES: phosphatidylserine decarboxylase [Bacillales]MCT6923259.1 phosphatidylserine decarboxylase [Metasolibacillus sp.]MCT6939436.1 phosphatidylserine decarboxylase [Metasolibacillus sp.]WPK11623.1 phosphatidylserine decarboxylase [Lysinibacillus louembei]